MTSHFWDIETLADDIERLAPGRTLPRPVVNLGSGFRSVVIRDAGGTVYRLGRTASMAKGYRYEVALLAMIRSYLPNEIPDPFLLSEPTERFPGGMLAYTSLNGRPIRRADADADDWEQLATDLGHFLAALHRIPGSVIAGLEKRPSPTGRPELEAMWADTSGALRERLEPEEMSRLERWWSDHIVAPGMDDYTAVLTHHDFWHENLLAEGEPLRLSGVLDWEHARLGDPAVDLVPLGYLGNRFAEEVMHAYKDRGGTIDEGFRARLAKHRVLREFGGIRYSVHNNDRAELIESIEKLHRTGVTDGRF